jgi:hypothetical protein
MTIEERLNEQIDQKDDQIQILERKIEQLESHLDFCRWEWQQHQAFQNDELSKKMPYPRLEMRLGRLSKDNWYSVEWIYGLVHKHYSDTDNDTLLFFPFSKTTGNGGNGTFESHFFEGKLELPRKDGFHIYADSKVLGLPAYIVCKEMNICQSVDIEGFSNYDILSKMKTTT